VPTVCKIGPYRFYFFSYEPNEPPHIHFGIHWPEIDEDLSIDGLLRGAPAPNVLKKRRVAKQI
jgi:hypothetical protein